MGGQPMTDVATGWTAAQIITLAAGSSVVAAILTQAAAIFREQSSEVKEGKFAALYVANALETYAEACSTAIYDVKNHESSNGEMGAAHTNIMSLADYPTVNWQALGIGYAESAMNFRTEVDATREAIRFLWDVDFDDAVIDRVLEDSAELGLRAFQMATQLRLTKGLTPRPPVRGFSVEDHLLGCVAERKRIADLAATAMKAAKSEL
jgi:hypothetical protein